MQLTCSSQLTDSSTAKLEIQTEREFTLRIRARICAYIHFRWELKIPRMNPCRLLEKQLENSCSVLCM